MAKAKADLIPILVRIDADLKAALDRLRQEEGILTSYVVNTAIREWIHRFNAPIEKASRNLEKSMAKERKERQKEEKEWQRHQDRVVRKIRGTRK